MGVSYAAGGRQGLREAAGRGGVGAALHSAGAGVCHARGQRPLLVYGAASSDASLPHSQTEIAPPGPGRQRLPPARSLKKTSAHSQDGLQAPPSGPEPARPRSPRAARLPSAPDGRGSAHLARRLPGAKSPRVLRPPSQGPLSLLRRDSHPAREEAPWLISSAPQMRGEWCP